MDPMTQKAWETAIDSLMELPQQKRDHFALLVIKLAECYVESNPAKAVILVDNDDELAFFSAGADDFQAADIVNRASELMTLVHTHDAPKHYS